MYQNWCPPKIHKYGENCPPKSAIGIPLRYQPPQNVLKRGGAGALNHQFESSKHFTYQKTLRAFRGASV